MGNTTIDCIMFYVNKGIILITIKDYYADEIKEVSKSTYD